MRKFRWILVLALVAAVLAWSALTLAAGPAALNAGTPNGFVPGEVLVSFDPSASPTAIGALHAAVGARVAGAIPDLGVQVVRVPAGSERAAIARYEADPYVRYAEPNYIFHATYVPDDPYYSGLYNTSNAGAINQYWLPKINAPAAWDTTRTLSTDVMVAIVDTGIDYDHPDLSAKVARNASGAIIGYNFVAGTADPKDDNGHGTHCAGIAAAATDNATGVAGASFNSIKIMPVKVLDDTGSGTLANVANGILWAADNGAKVISLSLGTSTYSQTLQDAVDSAWSKGTVIAAAAGNDGRETISYPGGCNYAIAVAATDETDAIASFSNWGIDIGIAAPGVHVLSTMPTYTVYLNTQYGYYTNYDALSGTSMATPVIAGTAAMLIANDSTLTNAGTVQLLQRTADNIVGTADGGWDIHYGYGRVNSGNAVAKTYRSATVGSFYGQVVSAAGAPVNVATVSAGGVTYKTGLDGMFRLANLPSGTYTVTATNARFGTVSTTATIVPGADVFLKLATPK
ncbi:MAG: S8 family serine peptidase [Bacillota bacterium]